MVESKLPDLAIALQGHASCVNPFLIFKRESRRNPGLRGLLFGGQSERVIMQLLCQSTDPRLAEVSKVQRYGEKDVTSKFPREEQDKILAEVAEMISEIEINKDN